jgi:hypothetical protein
MKSTPFLSTRAHWVRLLQHVARPPLAALADGRLRATMPVETASGLLASRSRVTHLEALGRTLAGLEPWLELKDIADAEEAAARDPLSDLAREAVCRAVDSAPPDCLNFTEGSQPLVDAAFLAHALLRAPHALFETLPTVTRDRLLATLRSTRVITPGFNNWLLFSAMIETALLRFTGEADLMRIDYAVRQHRGWYKGDGIYGDGPEFHWDYDNSFVIQPMMLDVLATTAVHSDAWREFSPIFKSHARRFATVLERLIAADGSFPPLGRSLAYRCGAFEYLAQIHGVSSPGPARARCLLERSRRALDRSPHLARRRCAGGSCAQAVIKPDAIRTTCPRPPPQAARAARSTA